MGFWRRGNYDFNTIKIITEDITLRRYYKNSTAYVGITANPVQSLQAHGIDIYKPLSFDCWDIPAENAKACKEAILGMEGYHFITDYKSDYVDDVYPNLYIYLYPIAGKTVQQIDTSSFTPLKKMPLPPIVVMYIDNYGVKTKVRYDDSFDDGACEELLENIKTKFLAKQLHGLVVKPRGTHFMELQFGEDCCIINYDPNTSQAGAFKSYRNGSKSRKLVKLFTGEYPEYMVCKEVDVFVEILRYFLKKNNKPGKRQNVKWVTMTEDKDVRIFCRRSRDL